MDINELVQKGIAALEADNFDEAMSVAVQLQQEMPKQSVGYHLEGLIQQSQTQWELSISAFNKAIEQSPYDPALFNFRGFAYLNTGNMAEAEKDFKEAISLEDYEPAHRNWVLWLIVNDRIQEAIDYLTLRIQTKQDDPENFLLMGDLMQRSGMVEKAQTYYDVAKELQQQQ